MADISAAIWNHALGKMEHRTHLSYDDMRALFSYVWSLADRGDKRRGSRIFAKKKCSACHSDCQTAGDHVNTAFSERATTPMFMISALGKHGSRVQTQASGKGIAWPRFGDSEMTDLIAYLEARARVLRSPSTGTGPCKVAEIDSHAAEKAAGTP